MHVPFDHAEGVRSFVSHLRLFAGDAPVSYIWAFDPEQPVDDSPFPSQVVIESAGGMKFVAPFVDGRLMVWDGSDNRLTQGRRRVIIVLDSDILSIVRSVMLGTSQDRNNLRMVLALAEHNAAWKAEIQPFPYLRQNALLKPIAETADDAKKAIEACLRVQALDLQASLASESIVYSATVQKKFEERFGVKTYAEGAEILFREMSEHGEPGLSGDLIAMYVLLLKLIEISLTLRQQPLVERLAAADDFISNVLIQAQPRFYVLARMFFSRRFGKLLKANPGDKNFVPTNIIGAVWDLYLTTLHEKFLGDSEPPEAWLSVLCTRDAALAEYGGRFPLRGVMHLEDGTARVYHHWDDPWLKKLLGEDTWKGAVGVAGSHDVMKQQALHDPAKIVYEVFDLQERLNIPEQFWLIHPKKHQEIVWIKKFDE